MKSYFFSTKSPIFFFAISDNDNTFYYLFTISIFLVRYCIYENRCRHWIQIMCIELFTVYFSDKDMPQYNKYVSIYTLETEQLFVCCARLNEMI